MCMNTSLNVHERLKLLRFIGMDIFFNQIALYHGVTQGDKYCIFEMKDVKGLESWKKIYF